MQAIAVYTAKGTPTTPRQEKLSAVLCNSKYFPCRLSISPAVVLRNRKKKIELGLLHMYVATQLSRRHFIFRQPIAFCMQSHRMATAEPVLRPLI